MTKFICNICGSRDSRADRALAGRMVCNACGAPYGATRSIKRRINSYSILNKKNIFVLLLGAVFIIIILN